MTSLGFDPLIHDFIPIFTGQNLKNCQKGYGKGVEIGGWGAVWEIEGASEKLHSQKSEN